MRFLLRWVVLFALTTACVSAARAADTHVEVSKANDGFVIDAVLVAPVPVRAAWAVLTDFDAMSGFLPDLQSSRITRRSGLTLRVEQRGVMRWGPFSHDFHAVREVELMPYERVASHVVSGTLRRADTETRFFEVANGTEVRHHIELAIESWLPDVIVEALLRQEVRQQFAALVQEMQRRSVR